MNPTQMHPPQTQTRHRNPLKKWPYPKGIPYPKDTPGLVIFFAILLGFNAANAAESNPTQQNALTSASSPYLIMHANDPVHWQPWQASVIAEAQRLQKPILLSSGYFACHWCHVMQKENYQDPEIADFLNQHFISVKIDRELHPHTDQALIDFSKKSAGHAGWPQHVILTPEGLPFYAFVYLPKAKLLTRLQRVVALWQSNPEQIRQIAQKAIVKSIPSSAIPLTLDQHQFLQAFNHQLRQNMDELSGGLTSSQKFPKPPLLLTLIQQTKAPDDLQAWLKLTLDQMQNQGLHDAVQGGFFRYTVDPEWQHPHFEKMLYTQALLAKLYFLAAKHFENPHYLATARKTLRYVETHLWNPATRLFMSSQSAIDAQGIEGAAYLWSRQSLKNRLTPSEFNIVNTAWQLSKTPPFELGWLPKITQKNWPNIQAKLHKAPNEFPTDHKSILSWNALLLSSYATAYQTDLPNQTHYAHQAQSLITGLQNAFKITPTPRALDGQAQPMGIATLEDYALTVQALKDWQTVIAPTSRFDPSKKALMTWQSQLTQQATQQFLTAEGWQLTSAPLLPGQRPYWAIPDADTPSATAVLDCAHPKHLAQAQALLKANPLDYASYANTFQCNQQESH